MGRKDVAVLAEEAEAEGEEEGEEDGEEEGEEEGEEGKEEGEEEGPSVSSTDPRSTSSPAARVNSSPAASVPSSPSSSSFLLSLRLSVLLSLLLSDRSQRARRARTEWRSTAWDIGTPIIYSSNSPYGTSPIFLLPLPTNKISHYPGPRSYLRS